MGSNPGYVDADGNPLPYTADDYIRDFERWDGAPADPSDDEEREIAYLEMSRWALSVEADRDGWQRLFSAYERGMRASTPMHWPGPWKDVIPSQYALALFYRDWHDLDDDALARAVGDQSEGKYAVSVERLTALRPEVARALSRKSLDTRQGMACQLRLSPDGLEVRLTEVAYALWLDSKAPWPDDLAIVASRGVDEQAKIYRRWAKKHAPKPSAVPTTELDLSKTSLERDRMRWQQVVPHKGNNWLTAESEFSLGKGTFGNMTIKLCMIPDPDSPSGQRPAIMPGSLILGLGDDHLLDTVARMLTERNVQPLKGGHLPIRGIDSEEDVGEIYRTEHPPTLFRAEDVWRAYSGQTSKHDQRPTKAQINQMLGRMVYLSMIWEEMIWSTLRSVSPEGRDMLKAHGADVTKDNVDERRGTNSSMMHFLTADFHWDNQENAYIEFERVPLRYVEAIALSQTYLVPEAILVPPSLTRGEMTADAVRIADALDAWSDKGRTKLNHSRSFETVGLAHWVAQTVERQAIVKANTLRPISVPFEPARELWEASTGARLTRKYVAVLKRRIAQDIVNIIQHGTPRIQYADWIESEKKFEIVLYQANSEELN